MAEGDNKLPITIGSIVLGGWLVLLYLTADIGALSGLLIGAAAGLLGAIAFPLFGSAYRERAKSFGPLPWFAYFITRDVVNRSYRPRTGSKR